MPSDTTPAAIDLPAIASPPAPAAPLPVRMARRAVAAVPAGVLFGIGWALLIATFVAADALLRDVFLGARVATLLRTYAIGAGIGGALAWTAAAAVAGARPATARFAALLVALPAATAAGVAAVYFASIYDLYAPEHDDLFTPLGMIQTAFTYVGGLYIVAVTGLRFLLPAAAVPVFAAAALFAYATRRRG